MRRERKCSFCGASGTNENPLLYGQYQDVCVCENCARAHIELFNKLHADENETTGGTSFDFLKEKLPTPAEIKAFLD